MSDNREMIVLNGEQIDELVRCKDCKWAEFYIGLDGKRYCFCAEHDRYGNTENDYCSYAERKEVKECQ